MSNEKKLADMNVFELLNANGQMDKIIDLFAEASDDELLPEHRKLIKNNVKAVTTKLDKMIVILKEVNDDPEKKAEFLKELEKQKYKVPPSKKEDM